MSAPSSSIVNSVLSPSQVSVTVLSPSEYVQVVVTGPVETKALPPDLNSIFTTSPSPV